MSAQSRTAPSQPTTTSALTNPSNAASKNPSESASAASTSQHTGEPVDHRVPQTQASENEAQDQPQGRGVRGAPTGEEGKGLTEEDVGRHKELDGEQMAMPGEGKVADAVAGRKGDGGVGGEQVDLAEGLDRKKEEQKEAREKIKQQRAQGTGGGGAAGQQGGPAVPVD